MNELESARSIINEADEKMAQLFEMRMQAVVKVAQFKIKNGLPVFDEKREQQVIEKNLQYIKNDELKKYYTEFIQSTMDISKKYQRDIIQSEGEN